MVSDELAKWLANLAKWLAMSDLWMTMLGDDSWKHPTIQQNTLCTRIAACHVRKGSIGFFSIDQHQAVEK